MNDMVNRRGMAQRYSERLDVEVKLDERWFTACSRNLSLGGIFIETSHALRVGMRLQLRFKVATQPEEIVSDCQVRWVEDAGAGVMFLGLRAREVWALLTLMRRHGAAAAPGA